MSGMAEMIAPGGLGDTVTGGDAPSPTPPPHLLPISNWTTVDYDERIHTQNWFAGVTLTIATLSCIGLLMELAIAVVIKDFKKPSARMTHFLNFAALIFSISWIIWACGHFAGYGWILLQYHEAANCAAFGLNTAGLFGILVGNCFVLWSAMYTLTYHQIVTWRLERGCYVIGALIVVVSGSSTGVLCRQRCGACSWDKCNTDCKDLFIDATFGWVIALALPLIFAIIFMIMGCCGRRQMLQHKLVPLPLNDGSGRAARGTSKIPYAWTTDEVNAWVRTNRFGRELFDNLWRDVKYYPIILLFFAIIYLGSAIAISKLFPKNKYYGDVNPMSPLALIVEISWILQALQGLLHVSFRPMTISRFRMAIRKLFFGYFYPEEIAGLLDDHDEMRTPNLNNSDNFGDFSEFQDPESESDGEESRLSSPETYIVNNVRRGMVTQTSRGAYSYS